MAGIAGIAADNTTEEVSEMLGTFRYRGNAGISVFEKGGTTIGIIWNETEKETVKKCLEAGDAGYISSPGNYVIVKPGKSSFIMTRDELGAAPLYYVNDKNGNMCFASEIKALLPFTKEIREMAPGHILEGEKLRPFFSISAGKKATGTPGQIAEKLYKLLDKAISECIRTENTGSWLSGGLDSSVICALATRHLKKLRTFAAGMKGAPDLEYAREVARYIKSEHHEKVVSPEEMTAILPEVIYHLESFDALLVRSSLMNYLIARLASEYVDEVFSGEGGDELFAGYGYLKSIPAVDLEKELLRITGALHNTALQRVDRCAFAHGMIAHMIFTNPEIVKFAFTIPVGYKIHGKTEKWLLRKSMEGMLPDKILRRPKAKFWEGAGVKELLADYAGNNISDNDFRIERNLSNGQIINSKEELLYYRIFREHFGSDIDLSWMGRTKVT